MSEQSAVPPAAAQSAPALRNESYGLKNGVLSPLEVLGQSVANIAPTATPTVVIPLVFAVAGAGTWFAYLFALVAVLLVSFSINQFARRSASPGSIYTYIATGLGPTWGIAVGWTLFIAYIACASSVTTGFTNYANVLAKDVSAFPTICRPGCSLRSWVRACSGPGSSPIETCDFPHGSCLGWSWFQLRLSC